MTTAFLIISLRRRIVKTTRYLLADWNSRVFRLFIYLIVWKHGSRGRRIAKEYKFKEPKDITPTTDKVSSEWRLFSKMNFITCRSTYHSSCYRKEGPYGGKGVRRVACTPPPPPQAPEVHFFINQRLKTKLSRSIVLFLFTDCVVKSCKRGHKPESPLPQNVF